MEKEQLKQLLFSLDKSKFEQALQINVAHGFYPKLNKYSKALWEAATNIKKLSQPTGIISLKYSLYNMSLAEEDDDLIVDEFEELIYKIFPEHNTWPKVKELADHYLGIHYIYGGYREKK